VMQHELREFEEVQSFRFGAHIQASDGEAGMLVGVVVDDQRRALTQVGIRVSRFRHHIYFVALDLITAATAAMVTLRISLASPLRSSIGNPFPRS
jgi:hypothetical protein